MQAEQYFSSKDTKLSREGAELRRVAAICDVSPYYLFMVARGHKTASPELAANIEYATGGAVNRRETLPTFPWDEPVGKAA
jgi:DNA-binding transcriptional regulator YdaS (Cro superfamily)